MKIFHDLSFETPVSLVGFDTLLNNKGVYGEYALQQTRMIKLNNNSCKCIPRDSRMEREVNISISKSLKEICILFVNFFSVKNANVS